VYLGLTLLTMNIPGMVTTEQAAEVLGVKKESIYIYVRRLDGFPQPLKVGRTLLFNEEALKSWRAEHPARRREGKSGGNE